MSKVVRSVKNVTKGYSKVQVKVRNATTNDPWGPTGAEMTEIAQLTFNGSTDFYEIMDMLDTRMNDKGKNWRHVLKSLKVLDYCLHEGSELVVTWARKNIYVIRTLREFQHIDDDGKDVGQNVRVSAKELTSLIMDEERLRTERSDRKSWKSRVTGINEYGPQSGGFGEEPQRPRRTRTDPPGNRTDEEDAHYRLAIEASKYEAEEDQKRRARNSATEGNDDDLAKAIKLSKEEEELRRKELEESNASSLFDDAPAPQQPQQTGWNQGYQQGGGVDWFGNPVDQGQQQQQQQQQPQNTGYLNSLYSQPTGFQQQPTGYQNGFQPQQTGFQPQQTGFDQSQFQPQQPNYLQQQNTLQPQQTAFGNPYAQQNDPNSIFGQPQQQQPLQTGAHNPWASPNNPQQDALKPTPTGSNNPFASSFNRPQPPSNQSQPTLSTLQEQKTATQFNQPSYNNNINNPITSYQPSPSSQQQQPPQPKLESDPNRARLNALLASGEGMDTFGNTGDLRIPAQHTAPGTFVNSSGQGLNRLHGQQTGNNPFFNQQQFTGAPQQQGVGGGFAARPQQTGPAGGGFGGNPYAGGGGQGGGGQANLIDI